MKMQGYNVELVTEYAKDLTWEERENTLSDQLYILAKQHRRISRLHGKVDYVVTDSPLLLGLVYVNKNYFENYKPLLLEIFNSFNNINFLLERPGNYIEIGRTQTLEEAKEVDNVMKNILKTNNISYTQLTNNMEELLKTIIKVSL